MDTDMEMDIDYSEDEGDSLSEGEVTHWPPAGDQTIFQTDSSSSSSSSSQSSESSSSFSQPFPLKPTYDSHYFTKATEHLVSDIRATTFGLVQTEGLLNHFRQIHHHAAAQLHPAHAFPQQNPMRDQVEWKDGDLELFLDVLTSETAGRFLNEGRSRFRGEMLKVGEMARELRRLDGFLDARQPDLGFWPLGSYLRHYGGENNLRIDFDVRLYQEWAFRRIWIRALHLPGIVSILDSLAIGEQIKWGLAWLYEATFLLYRSETERSIRPDPVKDTFRTLPHTWFSWVPRTRDLLKRYLGKLAGVVMNHPERPRGEGVTGEQLRVFVDGKLNEMEVLGEIQRISQDFMTNHPNERLLLDLICREHEFEEALLEDHVEDMLLEKQVAILDIKDLTNEFSWVDPQYYFSSRLQEGFIYEERVVRHLFRLIQQFNRARYGSRLFRDWKGERPWAKLYQLYDTEKEGNQWVKDAIRQFRHFTLKHANDELPGHIFGVHELGPTETRRKAGRLLGIHPIDYSEQQKLRVDGDETRVAIIPETCGLCKEEYYGGFEFECTVALLHCGHILHLKCIFEFWDLPGKYLHTCPICKYAPKLNWQKVALNPGKQKITPQFAHNLDDYETENATRYAYSNNPSLRALYDVPPPDSSKATDMSLEGPQRYWLRENLNALMYTTQFLDPRIPTWHAMFLGQPGEFYGRFEKFVGHSGNDQMAMGSGGSTYRFYREKEGLGERELERVRQLNARALGNQMRFMQRTRLIDLSQNWVAGKRRRRNSITGWWDEVLMPGNPIRDEEMTKRTRVWERYRVTSERFELGGALDYYVLPGTRFPGEQERAWLRRVRRRRNEGERRRAREERRGLFGLYSRF